MVSYAQIQAFLQRSSSNTERHGSMRHGLLLFAYSLMPTSRFFRFNVPYFYIIHLQNKFEDIPDTFNAAKDDMDGRPILSFQL